MTTIEPTPSTTARLYAEMERTLTIVRRRLARPLTLSEKILLGHLVEPLSQELECGSSYLRVRPDRVVLQDVLGQTAMLQFMQTGRTSVAVPTSVHCDHLIEARVDGATDLARSLGENGEVYGFLRDAAAKFGAGFWRPGAGIIHQVVLENYALPGAIILGTDSHTPNGGGLGACAVGVGGADAVEALAGLPWEILYPKRIAVVLSGELRGWSAPKDVILWVAGQLGVDGATNAIVEYIGPGARSLSATGKATITNMGAEIGATTSLFPADERMLTYLRATRREAIADIAADHVALLSPDPEVEADPGAHYDRVLTLDLSTLEPHVVGPGSPDRARPISALAAEVRNAQNGFPDEIATALIGSCTNSSYQDMSRAADVLRQATAHGLRCRSSLLVSPGSAQIRATIERDGQLGDLITAGATVLANACGPCIGQWHRDGATPTNTIVTSFNRNFPKRNDGNSATLNFIASPEVVVALALAGHLSFNPLRDTLLGSDGVSFRLVPPAPAPDVPTDGFELRTEFYVAPPAASDDVAIHFDPASERLQPLSPWPAWDGRDFEQLPLLMKTKGKTTTDHISPAGPWLRYRGHLDRFSENMLSGAINAFSDEAGHARNALTKESGVPIATIARDYRAHGLRWVVVGDRNYGEGSSREHAALSPRLLGGAAVIARSFARIHESNLKKQGLLALTFSEPSDYDRVREDDRVSIVGLAALAPGRDIKCRLDHSDGTHETIALRHSYSEAQLDWFRSGSALNAVRAQASAAR